MILPHSFSTGQILVIGDTLVNIKLKINRLDNYYMLLVPINLIAVFWLAFFFNKVGEYSSTVYCACVSSQIGLLCYNYHQLIGLTRVIPFGSPGNTMSVRSPSNRAIKKHIKHVLIVSFMVAYARITVIQWYLFENERIIWSL